MEWSRRKFLKVAGLTGVTALVAPSLLSSCRRRVGEDEHEIILSSDGPSFQAGHRLQKSFVKRTPNKILEMDTVIVGGGISGLVAARTLQRANVHPFLLLELEKETGGNSRFSKNDLSEFPYGAHYLPVPDQHTQKELITFLEQIGVVTGWKKGSPVYREEYLCFDPNERLHYKHLWSEGLIPQFQISDEVRREWEKFGALLREHAELKGIDDFYVFSIPLSTCSKDERWNYLHDMDMKSWLLNHGLKSEEVHWYVDYCMRDDFGCTYELGSAWAGLHYFCSRRGKGANAGADDVLTWPEGNGFLLKALRKEVMFQECSALVRWIEEDENGYVVYYENLTYDVLFMIRCKHVILATPEHVNEKVLSENLKKKRGINSKSFQSWPWLVANIQLDTPAPQKGAPLSWDNVIYRAKGLGYVHARHQELSSVLPKKTNITYYATFNEGSPIESRKKIREMSDEEKRDYVLEDLEMAHRGIRQHIHSISFWTWGHGMIAPVKGFMNSSDFKRASESINGTLHFAHCDQSGMSIFEEAFYRGNEAANKVIASYAKV